MTLCMMSEEKNLMTGDPYAMSQEIVELQIRVSELMVAVERITEQRDNAVDAAESLHKDWKDVASIYKKHTRMSADYEYTSSKVLNCDHDRHELAHRVPNL